jgi:hypothetical protein
MSVIVSSRAALAGAPSPGRLAKGGDMNLQSRLDSLRERHAALEAQITDEDQRPRPDSDTLMRLKIEKLRVKEEIERLREQVQLV